MTTTTALAVSQTTGELRLSWDPFIRHQHLIEAERPAVRAGGRDGIAGTRAVWKYTYAVKPAWLRRVAEPIGRWLLGREIEARIAAFAKACQDPAIVSATLGHDAA